MNVSKLVEGQIIKNYKELCRLLEVEEKKGKGRDLQINDWRRYFDFDREGHKYIITKILDSPIEKEDKKSENMIIKNINKGVYSKEMFPLVKEFVRSTDLEIHSKSSVMNALNLKNNNYDIAYGNEKSVAEYLSLKLNMNIELEDIRTILASMWYISQEKIDNAFSNLDKLKYIIGYENKVLCIWNDNSKQHEMVSENYYEITKTIYEGKTKALASYFLRSPKKTMDDYIELMDVVKENIDINTIEGLEKVNNKLNIEIYLRGLGEEARKITLESLHNQGMKYIKTFYYGYAYMKNYDIEWENEVLDIAKKEIHIESFKRAVKEEYMLNTFLNKWFSNEDKLINKQKSSEARKTIMRNKLRKTKKEMIEKINILFDIFVFNDTEIDLNNLNEKLNIIKKENIIPF